MRNAAEEVMAGIDDLVRRVLVCPRRLRQHGRRIPEGSLRRHLPERRRRLAVAFRPALFARPARSMPITARRKARS